MKDSCDTQRRWRTDVAFAVCAVLILAAFALLALWVQNLSHNLRVSNEARDLLARQVEQLGEKPVAGPPGSRGKPGESVAGPKGDRGPRGPVGPSGPTGPTGPAGKKGPVGSRGIAGESISGSPGAPGAPGTDGSVGPQGPPGPAGEQGEKGPVGPQGERGAEGPAGPPGPACPDGYSLQAPSYDPDALVCRKDGDPDPPSAQQPLSAGLDPQRRVYA